MSDQDPTVQRPARKGQAPTEPSLMPSEDDIARRRNQQRRSPAPQPRVPGSGPGPVLYAVIVILIVGVAGAGWFIASQQEALAASQEQLVRAGDRLEQLERRLNMTGENLSQNEAETQNQLKFWEDEIRKLWDVTNKRNRLWITQNQEAVKTQGDQLKTISRDLRNISATVAQHSETLGGQDQVLAKLADLDNRLAGMTSQQAEVQRRMRDLTDSVNGASQSLKALERSSQRELAEHDQAIKAIDAWRLQVNRSLSTLSSGSGAGNTSTAPGASGL